jgi:hypothetical protein
VRLRVSLDQILTVLKPLEHAAVRQYVADVLAAEFRNPIPQEAERFSYLDEHVPRNGIGESLKQIGTEGAQADVSFHVLCRWRKGSSHEPSYSG